MPLQDPKRYGFSEDLADQRGSKITSREITWINLASEVPWTSQLHLEASLLSEIAVVTSVYFLTADAKTILLMFGSKTKNLH